MELTEGLEGYVVDLRCLAASRPADPLAVARARRRRDMLTLPAIAGGYAIVGADGNLTELDPEASSLVARVLHASNCDHGIRLRVARALLDGRMRTQVVEEIGPPDDGRPKRWDPWAAHGPE
ncbi:MAG: hypothetical protein ACM31L_04645 [Actinomycetota bacterium]